MPVILLTTQEAKIRRIKIRGQSPGQITCETLSRKYPIQNKAGGVAQVVECLLSKHEALSSNSSTEKRKKISVSNFFKNK
jgi:superfamily II helicase